MIQNDEFVEKIVLSESLNKSFTYISSSTQCLVCSTRNKFCFIDKNMLSLAKNVIDMLVTY